MSCGVTGTPELPSAFRLIAIIIQKSAWLNVLDLLISTMNNAPPHMDTVCNKKIQSCYLFSVVQQTTDSWKWWHVFLKIKLRQEQSSLRAAIRVSNSAPTPTLGEFTRVLSWLLGDTLYYSHISCTPGNQSENIMGITQHKRWQGTAIFLITSCYCSRGLKQCFHLPEKIS